MILITKEKNGTGEMKSKNIIPGANNTVGTQHGIHPFADPLYCEVCKVDKPRSEMCIMQNGDLKKKHPFYMKRQVCMSCRDYMFVPIEANAYNAICAMTGRDY